MSAVIPILLPRQGRGGDVRNAPHPPVAAIHHLANALPRVDSSLRHTSRPDATPSFDDLTVQEQLDHIETCPDLCGLCENDRAWGVCVHCGSDPVEALPPQGLSRCCGSHVSFGGAAA